MLMKQTFLMKYFKSLKKLRKLIKLIFYNNAGINKIDEFINTLSEDLNDKNCQCQSTIVQVRALLVK